MPNLTNYEYDIFLSHNHHDQEWTTRLAERLEQEDWQGRKLRVFFSPWDIRPGQSIPLEIERALPKSRKVGLVMSPDAINSAWVELERLVTTYISVSARDERLIPLYRCDCEIPALLQPILSIDFREDDSFEENYEALLYAIKDESVPRRSRTPATSPAKLSPMIPRPPVVGFVARRDTEGRDIIERLKDELAPRRNQFVVLSGGGGVGKTTLAEEALRALSATFEQRVVLTSALGRDDYSLSTLLDEIVTQLGQSQLRALPPDKKVEQVQALVASAPPLIILDNFETIRAEEQARCFDFLKRRVSCPALITGRERIDGARNIEIPVMAPDEANEFLNRLIGQVGNPSVFAQANRDRIMTASERTPLVMEWLVGQIDLAMDPDTVLDELAHGGGEAAQQVFDRSFGLAQLGDNGRATLLAFSLFAPDASRAALAEVAGFGNDLNRLNEAVKRLARLHLLKSVAGSRLTVAGLTRELAKARLSRSEVAGEFRQRFMAHFLSYAIANGRPILEDFDALEAEKDNEFSSIELAVELKDWQTVMRLVVALSFDGVNGFLMMRGYWEEAVRFGKQALEAARNLSKDAEVARFSHNLGITHQRRGDLEEARKLYHESLEIKKKLGNQGGIAITLHQLGRLAHDQGESKKAQRLYHESLEIKKKLGNQSGIAVTLHQLAMLSQDQGEWEEARRLYHESLKINKKLGNQNGIAATLHQLAMLAQDQGEMEEARRLYHESLGIEKKLGNQGGIANSLHDLGSLAQAQGELEEARQLYHESLEINKKLGDQRGIASTLHQLATLAQDQGESEEARRLYNDSLEINKKLGDQSGIAVTLHQLARLAEDKSDKHEAVRLFREALEIFEKLGSPTADIARRSLARVEGKSS
jgi:tetratricopeptide (TPR) repeat protein